MGVCSCPQVFGQFAVPVNTISHRQVTKRIGRTLEGQAQCRNQSRLQLCSRLVMFTRILSFVGPLIVHFFCRPTVQYFFRSHPSLHEALWPSNCSPLQRTTRRVPQRQQRGALASLKESAESQRHGSHGCASRLSPEQMNTEIEIDAPSVQLLKVCSDR